MPKSLQEFLAFARTDAALQERVAGALKNAGASQSVVEIARRAGWLLEESAVRAELDGVLGDHELEGAVGGFRAPGEWFAESVVQKPVIKGPG